MKFIVLRVAHSASRRLWYGSVIVWEAGWERNRTLPCVTAAHADVTGVSRLDDVMEGLHLNQLRQNLYFAAVGPENETHSFLNRSVRIEPTTWGVTTNIRHPVEETTPMALQNVDVIDAQSFQAVLHRREDVLE